MLRTKDLSQCTNKQLQEFLDSFDVVLSDCDGVLWHSNGKIDGAIEALQKLQQLGKRVILVTNNSTKSIERYQKQLRPGGFELQPEQIINGSKVIAWFLKKINFSGKAYALASYEFKQVLKKAGIDLIADPEVVRDDIPGTLQTLLCPPLVKAVIVDFDIECSWPKMTYAVSCLTRDDVLYLVGALDEWLPLGENNRILGPGPLIGVITSQTGKEPITCAKPSQILKDYIFEECKVSNPRRCLFVGDTIANDMKFATMCGFQKFFVGTGCDTLSQAQENPDTCPEYYLECFGQLLPMLNDYQQTKS